MREQGTAWQAGADASEVLGPEGGLFSRLDPAEFVTVREMALGDLVTLAMTGGMTDPGGVLLALPYLMGDPGVRQLFTRGRR